MLSVKQGDIKYHFLSRYNVFGYQARIDRRTVSQARLKFSQKGWRGRSQNVRQGGAKVEPHFDLVAHPPRSWQNILVKKLFL